MQAERIKVLLKIEDINKERCEICIDPESRNGTQCECAAAEKVRKLGNELLKLTKPRNEDEYKLLDILNFKDMTGDFYWQFKAAEISDRFIRDKLGVSEMIFNKWKKANDLVVKRGVEV